MNEPFNSVTVTFLLDVETSYLTPFALYGVKLKFIGLVEPWANVGVSV